METEARGSNKLTDIPAECHGQERSCILNSLAKLLFIDTSYQTLV